MRSTCHLLIRKLDVSCSLNNAEPFVDGEGGDVAIAPSEGAAPGIGMCTPRPSIGKKKKSQ